MSTISLLGIFLLIAMLSVGKRQGWISFLSLLVNFGLFFLALILVDFHVPPLPVTLVFSVCILAVTIYMGTNELEVAQAAFISALVIFICLFVLVIVVEHFAQVPGFANEDSGELEGMSVLIGISYAKIATMVTLLSVLGAIAEAAMAIATGVFAMMRSDTTQSLISLLNGGFTIGKQIIGTTLNTLFFGFFGGLLALLVWFVGLDYSFGTIVNNRIFVAEMITVLISFIGVVLTVPSATLLCVYHFRKHLDKHSEKQ